MDEIPPEYSMSYVDRLAKERKKTSSNSSTRRSKSVSGSSNDKENSCSGNSTNQVGKLNYIR